MLKKAAGEVSYRPGAQRTDAYAPYPSFTITLQTGV